MNWITTLESPGHIGDAIVHFNAGIQMTNAGASSVEISSKFYKCLNKIQTEWAGIFPDPEKIRGETKTFTTMIQDGLDKKARIIFLQSEELKSLVYLEPQIMDHSVLRRRDYRPDVDIEPELVQKASRGHNKLKNAYIKYLSQSNEENEIAVLNHAAQVLYIVRSNIAHGEKTPYGPDREKIRRDETVCRVAIPLQKLLITLLLDSPDQKLVVYGTLARGKINHSVISDVPGDWEDCSLNGEIHEVRGLPAFNWDPNGPIQNRELFTASDLPEHWERLDHFEGDSYQRILVPVRTSNGLSIANCYQSIHPSLTK